MSKPLSSRLILRYLSSIPPKTSNGLSNSCGTSHFISHQPKVARNPFFSPWLANSQRTHSSSTPIPRIFESPGQKIHSSKTNLLPSGRNFVGLRYFSADKHDAGKRVLRNPLGPVKAVVTGYREAVGLQIEAFWKRNSLVLVGAVGLGVCILLWRIMFGIANTFVGLSEGMAKYGFLALSTAIVSFAGLYLRSRYTINPDRVYRIAMRNLNTSAGILEVMGAPLTGTDLRAYVMSGGGIALKDFKPRFRNKRCFLIFPIQGSERKGLVSVEVKNKKGQVFL